MGNIKQNFSIKDLELLSGIKAHTIRMWEKRYGVLNPERTDSNIRTYDINGLQKILNVAFLNENGYKISRISEMNNDEVSDLVQRITTSKSNYDRAIKSLKVAMMNFDQPLFLKTYKGLTDTKTFQEIFNDVFVPLMYEIGILWQAGTITPAHEQFISNLVKQKLFINIEKLQTSQPSRTDRVFVLFLPEEEIHDIGLYYLNYELLSYGYKVIFLGHSLPLSDLDFLSTLYDRVTFATYLTVKPDDIEELISKLHEKTKNNKNSEYFLLGRKAIELLESKTELPTGVTAFKDINQLTRNL
ncbi:MAG: MerR family transcriptional regulator [Flavobacteriaceae bacterium]|nr:MerR family transcriptional regulator [Flavobacteriaceae bacterium]